MKYLTIISASGKRFCKTLEEYTFITWEIESSGRDGEFWWAILKRKDEEEDRELARLCEK